MLPQDVSTPQASARTDFGMHHGLDDIRATLAAKDLMHALDTRDNEDDLSGPEFAL